jgi:hypothetical protein
MLQKAIEISSRTQPRTNDYLNSDGASGTGARGNVPKLDRQSNLRTGLVAGETPALLASRKMQIRFEPIPPRKDDDSPHEETI